MVFFFCFFFWLLLLFFFCSDEVKLIRKKSAVLSSIAALEYISTPTATMLTVITLVLTGQLLTPVNVFTLLSFINLLRLGFCMNFSYASIQTYDAYVSLSRIQDFLLLNNLDSTKITINLPQETKEKFNSEKPIESQQAAILRVSHFNHQHQQNSPEDESFLQDVYFTAEKGSLTVITGPVGSGKSTLLSAVAGEVSDENWAITYNGSVVYVPQIAWVFSGTIRENILFGEQYKESKYNGVVKACALIEDMQKFPDSDQTIVGERGAVLSGGQRARVSLARAVYAEADLYLLDDPLSALDFKVAQHICRECINGLLGQKTRLITTHEERVMRYAKNVIVLHKGAILGQGSFTELKESGILNTTIDSMNEKASESDNSVGKKENEEKDISNTSGANKPHEVQGLHLSEEDRAIGVVSSKLYWSYFRTGATLPVIIAGICFCLISQGKDLINQELNLKTTEEKRNLSNKEYVTLIHWVTTYGKISTNISSSICWAEWKTNTENKC